MSYKYEDVLDATNQNWKAELKSFLDSGKQVVVVNISPNQIPDCNAFAQEHDFTCTIEDKELNPNNYPEEQPKKLGFVHRVYSKRISN